jgi:hypothetical protein
VQTNNESPLRSPVFSLQDGGGISRNYFELTHALSQLGSVSCDLALGLYRNRYPFAGAGGFGCGSSTVNLRGQRDLSGTE